MAEIVQQYSVTLKTNLTGVVPVVQAFPVKLKVILPAQGGVGIGTMTIGSTFTVG